MQIEWLQDFVELANCRSFSRAAENRFVTQPAFGRRIRALEEWIGSPLVERTQPVSLTPAGRLLFDAAAFTLGALNSVRGQVQNTVDTSNKILRVATGRTLARTFLPDWYTDINQRFGPFCLTVTTSGAQEAIGRLSALEVDLLITYSSPTMRLLIDPHRYKSLALANEVLLPVSAPLPDGRPRFPLVPVANKPIPWLAFANSLTLRGILANHLANLPYRLSLQTVSQVDSYDAILELAKRGAGLAWLPGRLVREEVGLGRLVVVGDQSARVNVDIYLYALRGNDDPKIKAIWDYLLEHTKTDGEAL
jgi:DNA-binding transcriptional LysR family regulator